ncbi:hypothetical protein [Methylorubrum aminovorans]|uniref:hypothetical protein n=1 Tax=Methylorubrum aminovorans TaxID=269069 RepID=UPI003C2FB0E9
MFSDLSELHTAMIEIEPRNFVSHFIFEPVPFLFDGIVSDWIEWKTVLAENIDVDPRDIVLTGSAALGYSLNPVKSFKSFDDNSDIDCGIISPHYFDISWRYLRQLRPSWLSLPSKTKFAIKCHRERYIFSGTIAADSILELLPFGKEWMSALERMSQIVPTNGRQVKLRIYKDFDSLRYYQASNISSLRQDLVAPVEEDSGDSEISVISTEE